MKGTHFAFKMDGVIKGIYLLMTNEYVISEEVDYERIYSLGHSEPIFIHKGNAKYYVKIGDIKLQISPDIRRNSDFIKEKFFEQFSNIKWSKNDKID